MAETPTASALDFIAQVHQAYASLRHFAAAREWPTLGGQLLYVSQLGDSGRAFVIAGNITGAATLALSTELAALRQAQREAAVDFLVNSLDEALRILKNEIRKREPVAVAVSLTPDAIETEMMERGVLPNLLLSEPGSARQSSAHAIFLSQGAQEISTPSPAAQRLLIWDAPAEYAQNLAGFESIFASHLAPADHFNRRWLRLSPRYLGPAARRLRSVACDEELAATMIAKLGAPLNK